MHTSQNTNQQGNMGGGEYMNWENLKRDGLQRGNKRSVLKCLKKHILIEWETHKQFVPSITILKPELHRAFNQYHNSKTRYFVRQCMQFRQLQWAMLKSNTNDSDYGLIDIENTPQDLLPCLGWLDNSMKEQKNGMLTRGGGEALKALLEQFCLKNLQQSINCGFCNKETTLQSELNNAVPNYSREICTRCNNQILCRGCIRERQPLYNSEHKSIQCPNCGSDDGFIDESLSPLEGVDDVHILQKQLRQYYDLLQTWYKDILVQYKRLQQAEFNFNIESEKALLGYSNTQNFAYYTLRQQYQTLQTSKEQFLQRGGKNNDIFAKRWISILTHSNGFVRHDTEEILVDIFLTKGYLDLLVSDSTQAFAKMDSNFNFGINIST